MKISTTEARDILPELVSKAEQGQTIHFTRYGQEKAVLISQERYDRLTRAMFTSNEETA
ncbi:type II toxin-antitoxin system prevent-host-death family antitoxin [Streptomyces sp. NBC_00269]|uniref:type II toxin-antitoxin system Phd/YefM family antitoxin n=1 Tax=Streptomyces sp. NBC_00269 TaxID=2975696 RepID=UPI002E2D24D0|nr:type II toxin-antitoxin system prevent-host-death family antitoxin [Streptomyces sp. NBC_00269]